MGHTIDYHWTRSLALCADKIHISKSRARFRRRENRVTDSGGTDGRNHRTRTRHRFHRPKHHTTREKLKTIQTWCVGGGYNAAVNRSEYARNEHPWVELLFVGHSAFACV